MSDALRVYVGGRPFVIPHAEQLSDDELRALRRLSSDDGAGRDFVVHLRDGGLPAPGDAPHDGEPPVITVEGNAVHVTHERFRGVIDPANYEAVVERSPSNGPTAIELVVRTALSCRLPLENGLLLHSAGVVIGERAALFFGVSGAGKSTMTELLDGEALSDELVALSGDEVRATGFWGSLDRDDAPRRAFPIGALVCLGRGEGVQLERLAAHAAARRLLLVAVVPPHRRLWDETLRVIERLSHAPVYQLAWSPSAENARAVARQLDQLMISS